MIRRSSILGVIAVAVALLSTVATYQQTLALWVAVELILIGCLFWFRKQEPFAFVLFPLIAWVGSALALGFYYLFNASNGGERYLEGQGSGMMFLGCIQCTAITGIPIGICIAILFRAALKKRRAS